MKSSMKNAMIALITVALLGSQTADACMSASYPFAFSTGVVAGLTGLQSSSYLYIGETDFGYSAGYFGQPSQWEVGSQRIPVDRTTPTLVEVQDKEGKVIAVASIRGPQLLLYGVKGSVKEAIKSAPILRSTADDNQGKEKLTSEFLSKAGAVLGMIQTINEHTRSVGGSKQGPTVIDGEGGQLTCGSPTPGCGGAGSTSCSSKTAGIAAVIGGFVIGEELAIGQTASSE